MTRKARKEQQREIAKQYSASVEDLEKNAKDPAERLQGAFPWSEEPRFPGLDKQEEASPKLFLGVKRAPGSAFLFGIYLVNNSGETLSRVTSSCGGFTSSDDDILTVSGKERSFIQVLAGEAVLVDTYDEFLDSDFVLQLDISVESPTLGRRMFRLTEKGGFRETVLLDANGGSLPQTV